MSDALDLVLSAAGGVLLGGLFFGGLLWTVRLGLLSKAPALWFLGSLLIRTAVTLGGFYAVSQGEWRRLAACLLGFLGARAALMRRIREKGAPPAPLTEVSP